MEANSRMFAALRLVSIRNPRRLPNGLQGYNGTPVRQILGGCVPTKVRIHHKDRIGRRDGVPVRHHLVRRVVTGIGACAW